jgi:hypothetical protein
MRKFQAVFEAFAFNFAFCQIVLAMVWLALLVAAQVAWGIIGSMCIICIFFEGVSRHMRAHSLILDDHGGRVASSLNVICLCLLMHAFPRWWQQPQQLLMASLSF